MTSIEAALPPRRDALPALEQAAVSALARLLPEDFRARQLGEWTADLTELAGTGSGARWRYLFGAAWTLPALRGVLRRGPASGAADGPTSTPKISPTALAWLLLIGVGVMVVNWFITVPLRYVVLDVPGRFERQEIFDPKDLWPDQGPLAVLVPLWMLMTMVAYLAILGGPFVLVPMAIGALVTGIVRRRGEGRWLALLALSAVSISVLLVLLPNPAQAPSGPATDGGFTLAALGFAGIVLAFLARSVSRRVRIALVVVGLAAGAMCLILNLPAGTAMLSWYYD